MAPEQLLWSSGDSLQLVLLHRICLPDEVLIWLVEIVWPVHKSLMLAAVPHTVNTRTSGRSVGPVPHKRYLAQKGLQTFPNPALLLTVLPDQQKPARGMGPWVEALELRLQ